MINTDYNYMVCDAMPDKAELASYRYENLTCDVIDSLPPEKAKAILKDVLKDALKHRAALEKKNNSDNKKSITILSNKKSSCFSALFDTTSVATSIYELKKDNRLILTQYNPASEKMSGVDSELVVGLTIEAAFPSLLDTNIPDMFRAIARDQLDSQLYEQHYGDNRFSGWYEVAVFRMSENTIAVQVIDISKNKLAEEAQLESEDKFKKIFELSPVVMSLSDMQTRLYLDVNETFLRQFGFTEEEVIGVHSKDLGIFPDPSMREDLKHLFKGQGFIRDHKIQLRMKTGGTFHCLFSIQPVVLNGKKLILTTAVDTSEHKFAEDKLKKSLDDFERIFNLSAYMVAIASSNGYFLKVSPAFTETLGFSEKEFLAKPFIDFVHPGDQVSTVDNMERLSRGIPLIRFQNRYICKDGSYKWLEWTARAFVPGGEVYGIAYDVTDSKLAEDKLKLAANVFTHAREAIFITDAKASIIDVNDRFTTMTGYSREEVVGQGIRALESGRQAPEFYSQIWLDLQKNGFWSGELWSRNKNNQEYAQMLTISSVNDGTGQLSNYVAFATDITLMKQHQSELERIAHYDILTNLPNRVLLADRLSQAMQQCHRHGQSLAVVFLDLDGFKAVNDTHGHDFGDELLVVLSGRMKDALREGDSLSRIGGDEFVAVLADLPHVKDCEPVLDRLLLAASAPITIADVIVNVSASIGVTLYPQDNVNADKLIRHADQAMYVAKQSGKNRYHIFDTAQDDAVKVQRENLAEIRRALDNQEFVLHYQPNVNMRTGKVMGVEVLIRWQHPERGLLNPCEFLPLIENNPMCIEMGEWVMDAALTQISQWQYMGLNLSVKTSVNISAVQLQQADFVERLGVLLAAHPVVDPRYLQLEVLETSALHDVDNVSEIMAACMALGVTFALDDFGTGYSSLTHLRRLPASLIKIDQSFVRDMLYNPDDLAIVEGVIALAKSFKRDVIAEGVETIAHGKALLDLGCDLAQGYGIARPMPPGDVAAWVKNWQPDASWKT
jgi:diguanylate cyclase (GGDEF)-like protein/PAS domain S-box-containing protein